MTKRGTDNQSCNWSLIARKERQRVSLSVCSSLSLSINGKIYLESVQLGFLHSNWYVSCLPLSTTVRNEC